MMPRADRSAVSRVWGLALLLGALGLCGINLYFVLVHPQGCRALTVPLLGFLIGLGLVRWQWQLLVFVFLTPLVYWLPSMEDGVRLRLAGLMLPVVVLFWSVRLLSPTGRLLPTTRLSRALVLYVGLVLLSGVLTVWRYHPLLNFNTLGIMAWELVEANRANFWALFRPEFGIANETLAYVAGPIFLLLLLHSADAALLARVRAALLCSVTLAATVGVRQKLSGAQLSGAEGHVWRVYGTLGDANTFGAYLAILLPLMVAEAIVQWWPEDPSSDGLTPTAWVLRGGTVLATLLIALSLLWTQSRAAILATAVVALVRVRDVFIIMAQRSGQAAPSKWRAFRRYIVLGLASVVAALFMYAWVAPIRDGERTLLSLFSVESLGRDLGVRRLFWEAAVRMGMEPALTGVGAGNYRLFCNQYWPGQEYLHIIGDTHNYYLKPLAEFGLPGLGLFLWICWSVWGMCRPPKRRSAWTHRDVYHLGATAGLLALAIDMLLQHSLVQTEMQVIVAAVVALAVLHNRGCAADAKAMHWRLPRFMGVTLVVIGMVWSSWHTADPDVLVALAGGIEHVGEVAPQGFGARLNNASLKATFDLELGRALVLVLARTVVADGEPHSLALTVNGDSITTWSVDSDTSRAYRTFVFSRPGPSVFELRGDKVYVERITVIQGHRASALAPVDPATAQSRLVSVPTRVVVAAPE